jgi:dTDP-4-amino-4,6-dideoxygalactose transaminase
MVMPLTQYMQIPFLDLKAQYADIRAEIQAALEGVFTHMQFVGGPWVEKFEEEFARFVGARFAISVGSGTPAHQELHYPGKGSLPKVERLADKVLSLPIYAELAKSQLKYIADCTFDFYHEFAPNCESAAAGS